MKKLFSNVHSGFAAGSANPLDVYLKSPVVPEVDDLLEYWNTRLASPLEAPLAWFALDFLSVPGKSAHC